jgi:hypothetical protein
LQITAELKWDTDTGMISSLKLTTSIHAHMSSKMQLHHTSGDLACGGDVMTTLARATSRTQKNIKMLSTTPNIATTTPFTPTLEQ